MSLKSVFRKEWRILDTPMFFFALCVNWLILGLFLGAGFEDYQAMASQYAQLNNKKGATEMILGSANQIFQILATLWAIYFGGRSLAQEKQWQTHILHFGLTKSAFFGAKSLILVTSLALLALPFWFFVIWVSFGTDWDNLLLFSLALAQIFWIIFATAFSLTLSASQKQALSASLLCALMWLILWLAPILTSAPSDWVAVLRYLSPFEHFSLLQTGILSLQSAFYLFFTVLLSIFLMPYFWQEH